MFDILFARTFLIVGGMLCLTALAAKVNRAYETFLEFLLNIIVTFFTLILVSLVPDFYPTNLILVAVFSLSIGWQLGPTIERFGLRYKLRQSLKDAGTPLAKGEKATREQREAFEASFDKDKYHEAWQNKVSMAFMGTALAVIATSGIVFLTDFDFGFLGGILFVCVMLLAVMGLANLIFFRSKLFSLIQAYIGAVVFTLYLLYDFNRLEKHAGDDSWSSAIEISVDIYLDIIILFLDLLEILAESD